MGNTSRKGQASDLHQNWITTTQPYSQLLPHINLYRSRLLMNTITHDYIEEYLVHFICEEDYTHYMKETEWRQGLEHREPVAYLMPIRAFINTSTSELCTRSHTACIYFDKIEMRLTDINDIPFADAMYMMRVCLEGFGMLRDHFGVFGVGEDMVFITEDGEVKVWIHANLSSVLPNRQKLMNSSTRYRIKKQEQKGTSYLTIPSSGGQQAKQKPIPNKNHEQSYTQNSYQYSHNVNSHQNTYSYSQPSQQSMLKDIITIIEQNIDTETCGKIVPFSKYVRDRANAIVTPGGLGNQTSRNRGGRPNAVVNSRHNSETSSNQGSQKIRRKGYNFGNVLQIYKQYIVEHNINVPRRMEAIYGMYKNIDNNPPRQSSSKPDPVRTSKSPNHNQNNANTNNSKPIGESPSGSNKNSLNNSQASNTLKPQNPHRNPTGAVNQSVGTIHYGSNMNNSIFHGNYDESAVMNIGNRFAQKYGLDAADKDRTGTTGNNLQGYGNFNTNKNKSQVSNSFNVVDVNNDDHLRSKLYSESYATNIQPINSNRNIIQGNLNNNNTLGDRSLNNSRMSNSQANPNTILKIRPKNNAPFEIRRLATEGSDYSPSPVQPNLNSNPYITENTARSRNSSIQVHKITYPAEYRATPTLNYNVYNGGQGQSHHSQSQNSSINSNSNSNYGYRVEGAKSYQMVNLSGNNMHIMSNGVTMPVKSKQAQSTKIKYHSPLSTLLQQKYDHGSKLIRTNPSHNPNPKITINANTPATKNGGYRHTSNESTRMEAKLHVLANPNMNAIKYVKTPYMSINSNGRGQEFSTSPVVTKPNSVTLGSKNVEYGHINPAYVEKYIRDTTHHPQPLPQPVVSRPVAQNQAQPRTPLQNTHQASVARPVGPSRIAQKSKQKQVKYYTSNQCYQLDSEIAYDLADINPADV